MHLLKLICSIALLGIAVACSTKSAEMATPMTGDFNAITAEQWRRLSERAIYFGHQSLGYNILDGLRDIAADKPQVQLRIARGSAGASEAGLHEFEIGTNGDPASKNAAFLSALTGKLGPRPVLMLKYCFADVDEKMDAQALFHQYQQTVAALRASHPEAVVVHVTFPLTTDAPLRNYLNALRGRPTRRTWNAIRTQYNELLRAAYAGKEPVFDVAAVESMHANGSLEFANVSGKRVYAMADEWTSDEGHLNAAGRRRVAEQLLITLTSLPEVTSQQSAAVTR